MNKGVIVIAALIHLSYESNSLYFKNFYIDDSGFSVYYFGGISGQYNISINSNEKLVFNFKNSLSDFESYHLYHSTKTFLSNYNSEKIRYSFENKDNEQFNFNTSMNYLSNEDK